MTIAEAECTVALFDNSERERAGEFNKYFGIYFSSSYVAVIGYKRNLL